MTDPDHALAELSRAERALARAVDVVDLLDLARGAEILQAMIRALDAGFELEQRASIFRLRAERKLGGWLRDNVRAGNPQWSEAETIRLGDYGITRSQSSRWQSFAGLTDERFHAYLDDCLAKGWDVTAAGLLRYADAVNGKIPADGIPPYLILLPRKGQCALQGFLVKCDGPLTGQHILNKSKARGNEEVRAILVACPDEVMAQVCYHHNTSRFADAPYARRILLLQKIYLYGWAHMKAFFDDLPWKVRHPELTLEGMLDAQD
jgi:hypothetical protein